MMIKSFRLILICLCVITLYTSQSVAQNEVKVASSKVRAGSGLAIALTNLSTLKGFSCKFKQVLSYAEGGQREFQGTLDVLRPGKFRWHYLKPYEQLYVSNGQGIWLYEPDLMQVQWLQDLGEVEPIVIQLLDGQVGLEDVRILGKTLINSQTTNWHVRMGDKKKSVVEVWLGVRDQRLIWIESKDVLANKNRLNLIDVIKETPKNSTFEFTAPDGVDVIGA